MSGKLSLALMLAVVSVTPGVCATNFGPRAASSADLTGAPAVRTRERVNYEKYETRTSRTTYDAADRGSMYYTQPAKRSEIYKQYSGNSGTAPVRVTRQEVLRQEIKRKYYLAHPFFQPTKGKFGSVTDFSYAMNSYDLALSTGATNIFDSATGAGLGLNGVDGKWKTNQFSIKEDFSYGITDRIAVMAMLRYDISKYKFEWSNGPDDKMDDDGLNMYGIGAQWRFVDNAEWIATASAYYQHQKDVANTFILDLKGGYKIAKSTIYGLLRGWYVDLDGNAYGNGVTGRDADGNNATMFLAYKTNVDDAWYVEGGAGVFSVLDEDWTLNLEATFGSYDWHNQAGIKAALGWQPNDWFALNLYGKMAIYDSADDKNLDVFYWRENTKNAEGQALTGLSRVGTAKIDNYSEATVGLQAIFYF